MKLTGSHKLKKLGAKLIVFIAASTVGRKKNTNDKELLSGVQLS